MKDQKITVRNSTCIRDEDSIVFMEIRDFVGDFEHVEHDNLQGLQLLRMSGEVYVHVRMIQVIVQVANHLFVILEMVFFLGLLQVCTLSYLIGTVSVGEVLKVFSDVT